MFATYGGRRAFGAVFGLLLLLVFPVSAVGQGKAVPVDSGLKISALVSDFGPGTSAAPDAGISAISRGSFVNRANRICAAQVPALRKHAQRLTAFERRINEANQAGDGELVLNLLNRMATATVPVTKILGQRHTKLRRLQPVRGLNPRPVLTRLAAMNRAFRDTIRAMRALAGNPNEQTAKRAEAVATRLERSGRQYLKINQRFGLRSCSRQIY